MNRYGSCGNAVGMYGSELRPFPGEEVRPKIQLVRVQIQEFVNSFTAVVFLHYLTVLDTCINNAQVIGFFKQKLNQFV